MGQILYISDRITPLTGWSPEELRQNSGLLDQAIVAADRERVQASRDDGGDGWSITYRLRARTGEEIVVQETATVLDDHNDRCVVGTLTDCRAGEPLQRQAPLIDAALRSLLQAPGSGENVWALALLDRQLRPVSLSPSLGGGLNGTTRMEPAAAIAALQQAIQLQPAGGDTGLIEQVQQVLSAGEPIRALSVRLMPANTKVPANAGGGENAAAPADRLDILPVLDDAAAVLGVLLRLYREQP